MRALCGRRDREIGKGLNGQSALLPYSYTLSSSEARVATTVNKPVTPNPRQSGIASESRSNHHPALNPRHSGFDPESSPYSVMDPGSMSPRKLGDVRDDVALEAGVEQGTSIDASNTSCSPSSQARRSAETPKPTSFRDCPGIQKQQPPSPKPTSFRA